MMKDKGYIGIDYFRFIAALLIVAIHTSPLTTFSETGDFILTRIVARVAVPFFFMTSGFFLISRNRYNVKKLGAFVKRTALVYGIAILIYIPVNIYAGYFRMDNLLFNIIRDIVFDGTLYHLWYLPASVFGAGIAWYLVKRLDYTKALMIGFILYLIGLLGDSYFGMAGEVPYLKVFYEIIFHVSEYTRNGIFFAPVFFLLGGFIADGCFKITFKKNIWGLGISFALMLVEAVIVHHFDLQRSDSMYVFLLPTMFFLFSVIAHFKGKRIKNLRTLALIIYIIHPMMIIVTRMFAKLFHMQYLMVENSVVHYILVCLISVAFGVIVIALWNRFKPKKKKGITDRAYVEIDINNLEHNVGVLKKAMSPKCELMAVVKADAYGHGALEIATHLNGIGVTAFAVATIDEGIRLRKHGVQGEILVLGYTDINRAGELKKYDLMQTLIDYDYAKALNEKKVALKAHIKIDTGMHRLGILSKNVSEVKDVLAMKNIKVCGIFTHLCCSDSLAPDKVAFTKEQIKNFYDLIDELKSSGISIPKLHIQSSYGLLNYPELECDYARVGIALYGVLSSPNNATRLKLDLRPVLSLKSKVILIRSVGKGESIGYDRNFTADRDSRIAILPVGYADGLPRNLSCGKGSVLINNYHLPIIGRVCMDQLAVDITDAEDVTVGSVATLISVKDDDLSASVIADKSGSISNELLSRMGARLPVVEKYNIKFS